MVTWSWWTTVVTVRRARCRGRAPSDRCRWGRRKRRARRAMRGHLRPPQRDGSARRASVLAEWQLYDESVLAPEPVLDPDAAAVHAHVLGDEAEPEAASFAAPALARDLAAVEALEDALPVCGRDAGPLVGHH